MSGRSAKAGRRTASAAQTPKRRGQSTRSMPRLGGSILGVIIVAVVGLYFTSHRSGSKATLGSSAYPYAIGSPGPGKAAPALNLPSTSGGNFDLAAHRGTQVLLFFQEGLTCEPCWTQLKAIQKDLPKFRALGIGAIVSVTTDPLGLLEQKVEDEGITLPVLSDADASTSTAWTTNQYQMQMMGDRNGHSFILVGKDGRILWRADYGGAPKYTMYLPDSVVLAQLRQITARSG